MTNQPKGGMCATCKDRDRNCSALPFDKMPIIERTPDAVVVRCTEFKRNEP